MCGFDSYEKNFHSTSYFGFGAAVAEISIFSWFQKNYLRRDREPSLKMSHIKDTHEKAINHGSMPPSTRTKQQLLVSTAAACGCCWCICTGLSPGWCPWPPCSTTVRPPSPSPLPTITKIKCWMHLLLSHCCKLPLISSSNRHVNILWKKWDRPFFMSFFDAVMRLFLLSVAYKFPSCHDCWIFQQEYLSPRQYINWPMLPTSLTT